MKAAVLSDVHGNFPALKAVLDQIDQVEPDAILVAGDLIGGPDTDSVISILTDREAQMILGNMDLDLLKFVDGHFPDAKRRSRQWGFMRWHAENVSEPLVEFLRSLPEQREVMVNGSPPILMVHGSPRSPYESLFPDKEIDRLNQVAEEMMQDVLVCGHIHIQWSRNIAGKLVFNPGAVSAPLEGDSLSRYSILRYENDQWNIEPRNVEYDVNELRSRYLESGLLGAGGAVAKAFLLACETGVDVAKPFYEFALERVKKESLSSSEFIPDEVWLKAEADFPWSDFA
jgi:putative phosphoesterase